MRRVEHHRKAERFHDRNRAHVGHEIVVAERSAALGEREYIFLPASRAFSATRPISCGERNWPFFRFTILPVATAASIKSVWRQRNAGICKMSTPSPASRACASVVNVRQHRHAELRADLGERFQAGFDARPAKRLAGRAVGLVEAGLEDVKNSELPAGFDERGGDVRQSFSFSITHGPAMRKQPARRIEVFPDGGGIRHAEVLAAKPWKVNLAVLLAKSASAL